MRIAFLLLVLVSSPAVADLLTQRVVGDGSSVEITINNPDVHPAEAHLGTAEGLTFKVAGRGSRRALVQCVGSGELPVMTARVGRRVQPIEAQTVDFPEGAPAIWVSSAREGRAALDKTIKTVVSGIPLMHRDVTEMPSHFGALRFAPLILIELGDLGSLEQPQRQALRRAVAAGSTLVIGVGGAEDSAKPLADYLSIELGAIEQPGQALAAALPKLSGYRRIKPGALSVVLSLDKQPVVVEHRIGLGTVRVLATTLGELDKGKISEAALSLADTPLLAALRWLDEAPPLAGEQKSVLTAWIWALPGVLLLAGWLGHRHRGLAIIVSVLAVIAAAFAPVMGPAVTVERARLLFIPAQTEALVLGQVDVRYGRAGIHAMQSRLRGSLEDVTSSHACLIDVGDDQIWLTEAGPGERRRLAYLAVVDQMPNGPDPAADAPTLASWTLASADGSDGVAIGAPSKVERWRLVE